MNPMSWLMGVADDPVGGQGEGQHGAADLGDDGERAAHQHRPGGGPTRHAGQGRHAQSMHKRRDPRARTPPIDFRDRRLRRMGRGATVPAIRAFALGRLNPCRKGSQDITVRRSGQASSLDGPKRRATRRGVHRVGAVTMGCMHSQDALAIADILGSQAGHKHRTTGGLCGHPGDTREADGSAATTRQGCALESAWGDDADSREGDQSRPTLAGSGVREVDRLNAALQQLACRVRERSWGACGKKGWPLRAAGVWTRACQRLRASSTRTERRRRAPAQRPAP